MRPLFRSAGVVLAAAGALAAALPTPAHAWWRGGVVIGVAPVPFFVGPPVVYAPPPYYPYYPPPVAYTPVPPAPGRACYAASYVCPLPTALPPGAACSCPANDGGRIPGRSG